YVAGKGDINVDGIVDIYDIVLVALAFDSDSSQPNWNPNADINDDCKVDIFDIVIVALNFDETYQYP
ncbi:MAG: dockerin type I domain-containing protein, partial [Candidatus Bathyarchaeia archaeon]